MNEQDGVVRPRLRIVDTTGPEYECSGQNRRMIRRRQNERAPREEITQQAQLRDSTLERGEQAAELSAMEGVHALRQIAERMRRLGPLRPALQKIMLHAESEAARLRTLLDRVYEGD